VFTVQIISLPCVRLLLSPVHTGDYYSRRIRQQSPFSVTVAEIGDYSLQCGPGFRCCSASTLHFAF